MVAAAVYIGKTQAAPRIPSIVIVALILLGPLGLVGILILWFRFRQGRLTEPSPPS